MPRGTIIGAVVLFVAIAAGSLFAYGKVAYDCSKRGGIVVQQPIGLACVKPQE